MPGMANVTVKKNDGTTDILYTAMNPASGDAPAIWRSLTVGTAPAHKPEIRMTSQWNGPKTARRVRAVGRFPSTIVVNGDTLVKDIGTIEFNVVLPQNMAQSDIDEMVSQFSNFMLSGLARACMKEGFAPT